MVKIMLDHQPTHCSNASHSWEYQTIQETSFLADQGSYTAYGIQAYRCQKGERYCLNTIHDISTRKDFVEQLAACFTAQQLSPLHFYDAVIDLLP